MLYLITALTDPSGGVAPPSVSEAGDSSVKYYIKYFSYLFYF